MSDWPISLSLSNENLQSRQRNPTIKKRQIANVSHEFHTNGSSEHRKEPIFVESTGLRMFYKDISAWLSCGPSTGIEVENDFTAYNKTFGFPSDPSN
jgi:hypothetical protein